MQIDKANNVKSTISLETKKEQLIILQRLNKYLNQRSLSHHPDCDQYDHHVFDIKGWILCVGDAGVYSALLIFVGLYYNGFDQINPSNQFSMFFLGMIFFTPAIIQLRFKSRKKMIKFLMRFSLGISIFYLLLYTFSFSNKLWLFLNLGIFLSGVLVYAIKNSRTHLAACHNCVYGESYPTCLIRHQGILNIPGIEKVRNLSKNVDRILKLKVMRENEDYPNFVSVKK